MKPAEPVHADQVDALRGWAAGSVLMAHTFQQHLLPRFAGSWIGGYLQADRAAVLLFFVISGYVIGLGQRRPCTAPEVRRYGWRRLVRIGPIYLLGIALGWLATENPGWLQVAGHLVFLQDGSFDSPLRVETLAGNTPLWSLHHEALYYAAFLAWWRWPRAVWPTLGAALAGAAWFSAAGGASWWTSHAVGATFWLAGLLLARTAAAPGPAAGGRIVGQILWLHAVYHFAPVELLCAGLHHPLHPVAYLPLGNLVFLPGCLVLVAVAGQHRLPYAWAWTAASALAAAAGLLMVLAAGKSLLDARWLFATGFLVAGALAPLLASALPLGVFTAVGRCSYALYALHFPVLLLAGRLLPREVSPATGLLAAAAAWGAVLPAAWWLERWLQPRLRAALDRRAGFAPA